MDNEDEDDFFDCEDESEDEWEDEWRDDGNRSWCKGMRHTCSIGRWKRKNVRVVCV